MSRPLPAPPSPSSWLSSSVPCEDSGGVGLLTDVSPHPESCVCAYFLRETPRPGYVCDTCHSFRVLVSGEVVALLRWVRAVPAQGLCVWLTCPTLCSRFLIGCCPTSFVPGEFVVFPDRFRQFPRWPPRHLPGLCVVPAHLLLCLVVPVPSGEPLPLPLNLGESFHVDSVLPASPAG